ncbi:DUF3696 domain-containing protein [candidate division KSB1 bacterium]|nr:DUF3696 domain-containing protein [candidate division KSB1 bacterium]
MITELDITNFKSWQTIRNMKLAPITGLFGANSSGKTSILQLLLMLKQTVNSSDRAQPLTFGDETTPVNLGTFKDIIFGHTLPGQLSWNLKWKLPAELRINDPADPGAILFKGDEVAFSAEIDAEMERLNVRKMAYQFGNDQFSMSKKGTVGNKYNLKHDGSEFKFIRTQARAWDLPAPVKCYGFPDQVKAYFQNAGFLADFQLAFEELFDRLYYLGPLREFPKRQYTWGGAEPADVGQRGERVVDALMAARQKGKIISMGRGSPKRSIEEHVAFWLKELGLVYDFTVESISKESNLYRVLVQKSRTSAKVLITDIGFGVSQILPALVLCFYVPEGSTILLEQPEIHLHPSVQAGLADVFIDAVKRRNVQIIFESHSEHLLRRLQRRIAEEQFPPDSTSLYFCEMQAGQSNLARLELDLFGNIVNWPADFFGDEFGELAAMTRAAMERKKNGG